MTDQKPTRPVRSPWRRAAPWLVGATVYVAVLTLTMISGADLIANGIDWQFLLPQAAALVAAAATAAAAFASTVPGLSRRALLLPTLAIAGWVGSLAAGAVLEWDTSGLAFLAASRDWPCVAMIVVGSVPPAAALAAMLRYGNSSTPRLTASLGMFAAAALVNVGACLSHPQARSIVTLVWHGTTILALVSLSAWSGTRVLTLPTRHDQARS